MSKLRVFALALIFAMSAGALVVSLVTARNVQMNNDDQAVSPQSKSKPMPVGKKREYWV